MARASVASGEIELHPISADPDFERIADELYAARPDEFASARDEQVRKARADGRPELARELNKLRKPTQSAWLVNLLWRGQRDVMQQLFELAAELSRAQAGASGEELRGLTAQRRQLESALLRQAQALAAQSGVRVTDATAREAQETLAAALANPEVADVFYTPDELPQYAHIADFEYMSSQVDSWAKRWEQEIAPLIRRS